MRQRSCHMIPKTLKPPRGVRSKFNFIIQTKLFASNKLNNDIVDINVEIETKEEDIRKLMDGEENHFLVKAKYERNRLYLIYDIQKITLELLHPKSVP